MVEGVVVVAGVLAVVVVVVAVVVMRVHSVAALLSLHLPSVWHTTTASTLSAGVDSTYLRMR